VDVFTTTTAAYTGQVQNTLFYVEPDGLGNWRVRTSQYNDATQKVTVQSGLLYCLTGTSP
jgi:hypothetical protein